MFPLGDNQPARTPPVITMLIIAVCACVFLHQLLLDDFSLNYFMAKYALVPAHFRPVTLVTSAFMHAGWLHILFNMLFLWAFGKSMEDAMGHWKFLAFYLLCAVGAGLVHVYFNLYSRTTMVGASGAIAGVMGAYLIKFPRAWVRTLVFIFVFVTVVDIPAWFFVIYWFVGQLFNGVGSLTQTQVSEGGTAWFAHIGGFVSGMALVMIMGTRNRYMQLREHRW